MDDFWSEEKVKR